jgi:iron complex outermembrane recepter protein
MSKGTCVLGSALLLVLAVPGLSSAQTRLDGRVTDPAGAPLADVQVEATLIGAEAPEGTERTTPNGEFAFSDLPPGTYVVRVAPTGFVPAERRATLNARGNVHLEFQVVLAIVEQLNVVGGRVEGGIPLDIPSETGSRLGLTTRELPSSLELVTQVHMEERGYRTVQEAVESAVGVTVGDHPSDTRFTTRGFTQAGVPVFYEGIKVAVPHAFPTDAWNLERLEILKGPSSSLYGEGAVAGAVNFAFRRPDGGPRRVEGTVSYGGFNTVRLGLGAGGPIGQTGVQYRVDYSLNQSDGFVQRNGRNLYNLTSALAWQISPAWDVQLSFDTQHDDFDVAYWGTPLVTAAFATEPISGVVETIDNRTVDRRMSQINYNAGDVVTQLDTDWTQAKLQWRPAAGIAVRNSFYYSRSDREWKNAESYSFDPATSLINRDRFFVSHGVSLVGNRLDVSVRRPIGGFANRFFAGVEVNAMQFDRVPFFVGNVDTVDPLNPAPGVFGPLTPTMYTVQNVDTAAFFAEDYFSIRSDLKLAVSARAERIDANRGAFTFAPGQSVTRHPSNGTPISAQTFGRIFTPFTWKTGLIYDLRSSLSLYTHVATSADPANADLVFSVANFDLATGTEIEVGAKQTLPRGAEWTVATYRLIRKNILTPTSPTTSEAVGQQSSRGVEASFSMRPIARWHVRATVAALNGRFDDFKQTVAGVLVSRDGNRPPNVPNFVLDLQSSIRLGDRRPVELGAAYHHIGDRFNGLDNSVRMLGYERVDAFAAWTVDHYRITGRIRNLLDAEYANWGSANYTRQISLGAPRSAEIGLSFRF